MNTLNMFRHSPKVKVVDGLAAVPIHITQVNATITFNGASKTTQGSAEMQFEVGPYSGYPFFDLITISSEFDPLVYKPDEGIFNAALAKAGFPSANNDTVFVTENLSHINAARNLGWRAIHSSYGTSCTAQSGECIEDLDDLLELFPPLDVDVWIRDHPTDPGDDHFQGSHFWNSPDLWIRNQEDGGLTHQSPEAGQDNWFYFDPESNCKGVDGTPVGKPGDLRFTYVPWHPTLNRRFDRDVADGWAWGGSQDNGGYKSEEILATTLFNIYRAIGGDSANLGRRQFASRMAIYLILRAIQNLTPASNPAYAREFAAELMTVDALNWTSEGVFGGAYGKVIRWAFEKQGEYQSPLIVNGGPGDGSVTMSGNPPDVDVYINDGRNGEYDYQAIHWNTTTVWNRRSADGLSAHEEPELGSTNYMYVKIKNRGTQQANNVVVKGYHTKPGAGLLWPVDFESFTTAQIAAGTLSANNTEEKTVGPSKWMPNTNAYRHDCVLMVVSADGDPANTDNFTAGESIPLWRLVPNDNNTAQRNVCPVAGGGSEGLMASLSGFSFWVRNPNPRRAMIDMRIQLPRLLEEKGWRLTLEGLANNQFSLASGAQRELVMRLHAGRDFTPEQVAAEPSVDILIEALADDNPIGGMTYRLNPNIKAPHNSTSTCQKKCCKREAQDLIDCLGVKGKKVKSAKINEIILGIKLDNDCCDC